MVEKIISGMQSGVDQVALRWGTLRGFETGGWAPKGFKTEYGFDPWFANTFGVKETESSSYLPRTERNVKESDATLIITRNPRSKGTLVTVRFCKQHKKSYLIISQPTGFFHEEKIEEVKMWLKKLSILDKDHPRVLNVGGNRGSIFTDAKEVVQDILNRIFDFPSPHGK